MKCYMTGKPCDYFKEQSERGMGLFIISPFGFPYDALYSKDGAANAFKALKDKGYAPKRSDQAVWLGSIMCQGICKEILEKSFVLADLSRENENVYYELGLSYALKKKLIICANKSGRNRFVGLFEKTWKHDSPTTFIIYENETELVHGIRRLDPRHAFRIPHARLGLAKEEYKPPSHSIVVLENGEGEVGGLYQRILDEARPNFDFPDELLESLSEKDKNSFKSDISRYRDWKIETIRIDDRTILEDPNPGGILDKIYDARIVIVDTSPYPSGGAMSVNPYMFFFLGLAHGLEKDVIPVTNTKNLQSTPFDVTGLWHVFYTREDELSEQFRRIIPRICVDFHREKQEMPYRWIWDEFLNSKKRLSIIYCGRPIEEKVYKEQRGPRTNVDSWDSKAVSEASFYLAQKYPTTLIKPEAPKTKSEGGKPSSEVINAIEEELKKDDRNWLIIGSPDVNDYAEIALARLFGVEAFSKPGKGITAAFQFGKDYLEEGKIVSAFLEDGGKSKFVRFKESKYSCEQNQSSGGSASTYGVLVIAKNPFNEKGRVMVVSGFTGLATCGLMFLVIDTEQNQHVKGLEDLDRSIFVGQIVNNFNPKMENPFIALVKFYYKDDSPVAASARLDSLDRRRQQGDKRRIVEVMVPQIEKMVRRPSPPKRFPALSSSLDGAAPTPSRSAARTQKPRSAR